MKKKTIIVVVVVVMVVVVVDMKFGIRRCLVLFANKYIRENECCL